MSIINTLLETTKEDKDLNYWTGFEIDENHPKRKERSERLNEYANMDKVNRTVKMLRDEGYDLEALGEEDFRGEGSTSRVYKINNNNVIKIGDDNREEVAEYNKLVGKKLDNVANIKYAKMMGGAGVVIMENLFTSDFDFMFDDKKFFDVFREDFTGLFMDAFKDNDDITEPEHIVEIMLEGSDNNIEDFTHNDQAHKAFIKYIHDIYNGLKELEDNGVRFNDVHGDNVMMDKNSNFKIVDFYYK